MLRSSIVTILLCFVGWSQANVDLKDFYPYGTFDGGTNLPKGIGITSPPITLLTPVSFGGSKPTIWVSNGGFLSFQGAVAHAPGTPACLKTISVIAPFKAPVNTEALGDVFYRQAQDAYQISTFTARIQRGLGLYNMKITSVFIAVWEDVTFPGYAGPAGGAPQNTFFVFVATDGKYSYAIFEYIFITWTQGDFVGTCMGNNATGVGGACQAEIGFTIANVNSVNLDGSCGDAALTIGQRSNIGQPGVWVLRIDNGAPLPVGRSEPAFFEMMGHNAVQVTLPDGFNATNTIQCTFVDKNKGNLIVPGTFIPGQPVGNSNLLSCTLPFLYSFGDYSYSVQVSAPAGSFQYSGSLFITTPEPHVDINVVNASLVTYRVQLNITWEDTHSLTTADRGPVDVAMYVWDNAGRTWGPPTIILKGTPNTGQADVLLVQPNTATFLTKHLIISVGTGAAAVFSPMFIFEEDNVPDMKTEGIASRGSRFRRRPRNAPGFTVPVGLGPVWQTVGMMGHVQLQAPFAIGVNYTAITCNFQDPIKTIISVPASVSVDKSKSYCYVPFLYAYGNIGMTVTAKNGVQNVSSSTFTLDVLPPDPDVTVVQKFGIGSAGASGVQNTQYKLQLEFTWSPATVPATYPYLSAYIFVFDETTQAWQDGLLVNPTQIPPNAGQITLSMSDESIMAFFDNKVMFGLCYFTTDDRWGIFSKMFHLKT